MCGKNGLKVLNPNLPQLYYKISKIEKWRNNSIDILLHRYVQVNRRRHKHEKWRFLRKNGGWKKRGTTNIVFYSLCLISGYVDVLLWLKTHFQVKGREWDPEGGLLCLRAPAEHLWAGSEGTTRMGCGKGYPIEAGRTISGKHRGSGIVGVTTSLSKPL